MANITDLIMQQVQKAAGNVEIPSNVQNTVLNGLSESILGSLTQTATKAGGIDMIKSLLSVVRSIHLYIILLERKLYSLNYDLFIINNEYLLFHLINRDLILDLAEQSFLDPGDVHYLFYRSKSAVFCPVCDYRIGS